MPNADVELDIRGVARERIDGGEVVLTLPTRALMDHAGTGHPDLPAEASWDLPAMDSGDTWSGSYTVPGEAAGYYRVMVNAYTHGPDGGLWLFDDVLGEAWMYISETDGQLTRFFEDSIFPDSVHPAAGPADGAASRCGPDCPWHPDSVYLSVVYSVSEREDFKPAAGAEVRGWLWEAGSPAEPLGTVTVPEDPESHEHYIPGIVAFRCTRSLGKFVRGDALVPHTDLVSGQKTIAFWVTDRSHCGQLVFVEVKAERYLPWRLLNLAADTLTRHFGHARGPIEWKLNYASSTSYYSRSRDEITLAWELAGWSVFLFVAGHEYGHALHEKALGGLFGRNRTPGCDKHSIVMVTTYQCALSEGFAHYAGNVGSVTVDYPDGYYHNCFEHFGTPKASPSGCRDVSHDQKPKIEGWITALFMDLTDSNDNDERHDHTDSYPGRYVAEVFKTCKVKHRYQITPRIWKIPATYVYIWWKRSNASNIVWCLERNIEPSVHEEVFPDIRTPVDFKEKATEPPDWDRFDIRTTWLKNLK